MPTRVDTIEAALILDTAQFELSLKRAAESTKDLGVAAGQGSQEAAKSIGASTIAVGAFATAAYGAVDAASKFETGMRTLNTIAGYSEAELAAYSDRLATLSLDLGSTTSAGQNAAAAFEIAGAGFTGAADNAKVLDAVLQGATAGQVDAAKYGDLMTGTLNAFGASADEAGKYGDLFFRTIDLGKTSAAELSSSLGKVTPVAAAAGVGMGELGGVIATLTSNGMGTAESTEAIRGALSNLIAPSAQSRKELARLGLTVNQETLRNKGLVETLKEIQVANGGSAESFKLILGDVQATTAALSLMNDGGVKATSFIEQMGTSGGATAKAMEQVAKTFSFSWQQMTVALEAAAISVGQVFLPPLKLLVDTATSAIQTFLEIPEPIRNTGVAIAGLGLAFGAAVSALGALSLLFGGLSFAMNAAKVGSLALSLAQTQLGKAVLHLIVARARDAVALTSFGSAASNAANRVIAQSMAMKAAEAASYSLATGQTATTASTGGLIARVTTLIPLMARLAGIAGLGALAIYKVHQANEATIRSNAALERSVNAAAGRTRLLDDAFRSASTSVEELMKSKTGETLSLEIQAVRQGMQNLKESFDAGNLSAADYERQVAKLAETLKTLEGKRGALEANDKRQIKAGNRSAESLSEEERKALVEEQLSNITKLSNAKEISAKEEIALLDSVLQKAYVNADERRKIEEDIARLRGQVKTDDSSDAEDRRKADLDAALSEVKQLSDAKELSARQEIAMLEEILQKNRDLRDEERLRIKEQIAGLQGRVKTYDAQQADKAAKESAKATEKARKETLDAELDRIKALRTENKISANEEINQLKRVLSTYQLTESEKRTIHQRTLQIRADAEKKAAADQAKADKQAAQEKEDLSKARDDGDQLKSGANDRKVAKLQDETEKKGVDNRKKINAALKENLVLQLQQIQREADRELVGVQSADLIAQVRANAEAKMREEIAKTAEAQKSAVEEQIAALKRLEEQKNGGGINSSFGSVFGIEELGARLNEERKTTTRGGDKDAPLFQGQSLQDIENQLTRDIGLKVEDVTVKAPGLETVLVNLASSLKASPALTPIAKPAPMATPIAAGTGPGSTVVPKISGQIDVRVSVEGDGEIDQVEGASLDGRYSEISRSARGLQGRISFGGG